MITEHLRTALSWFVHRKPIFYGVAYLFNILFFTVFYAFIFKNDFKEPIGNIASLYFSMVTVTTLGYGDIVPKLSSSGLLLTVTSQVTSGIILIGLFLNALSHQFSDSKDLQAAMKIEAERKMMIAKIMVILKPIIEMQLITLAEIYKVTSISEREPYEIRPKDLFTDHYFDQVSLINCYSEQTRYGTGKYIVAHVLLEDNKKFQTRLDSYISRFSFALPIDILKRLNDLQGHSFLDYPNSILTIYHLQKQGVSNLDTGHHYLAIEHSSQKHRNFPTPMKNFHHLLSEIIEDIESYLPDEKLKMKILLQNYVAPAVGSAIIT